MPWNLLILPLVAGYYLLTRSYFFKFKQQRLEQQRLVFESIILGVILSLSAYGLRIFIESFSFGSDLIFFLYKKIPSSIRSPLVGTSLATLFLAFAIHFANLFLLKWREYFVRNAIKSVGNEFERIVASGSKKQLLQFTLSNGKFYIAWAKELPIPTISNYVRLLPAFSGYRTEDTQELIFTTQYLTVYADYIKQGKVKCVEELNVDFVISRDKIVSVSLFDLEMYERFNLLKLSTQDNNSQQVAVKPTTQTNKQNTTTKKQQNSSNTPVSNNSAKNSKSSVANKSARVSTPPSKKD